MIRAVLQRGITMIELAKMSLDNQEDIVEFRNKLLALLMALQFNDMKGVNIATKISDLIHHLSLETHNIRINIYIQNKSISAELQMSIIFYGSESLVKNYLMSVRHEINYQPKNGETTIQINLPILDNKLITDNNYIIYLREKIIVQTKRELLRQVEHKNQELNSLLNDLKKSSGLIQSEKMRALGVLTAGVAHELNNPMMGILNFIQYCLKKTDANDKRFEPLKDAEHETKRCIDIVTNLLTFSHLEKEGEEDFKPVNVATIIKRVSKILTYRLRNEDVTLIEEVPENLPLIMGHENRLQQVILNLVTNALDAMKKTETKVLRLQVSCKMDNLKLLIEDSGEGMDEDTKKQIFDPFFTTKPAGSGTGLGLSVCDSIIKEHHGNIICHSEKNKGTIFYITLPSLVKETA
ncbi:MAG: HAMP domain-containing histidine kinase [Gammaproteobacteria bacterium]|nr:MAG: HAMP domain-containing histidine kinase [Gammaproteobacteria bacterium]